MSDWYITGYEERHDCQLAVWEGPDHALHFALCPCGWFGSYSIEGVPGNTARLPKNWMIA